MDATYRGAPSRTRSFYDLILPPDDEVLTELAQRTIPVSTTPVSTPSIPVTHIFLPLEQQRDLQLFTNASEELSCARDEFFRQCKKTNDFMTAYNGNKSILEQTIKKILSAYVCIRDINYRCALISRLFSSAIIFPEITFKRFPIESLLETSEYSYLDPRHETFLELTRKHYQEHLQSTFPNPEVKFSYYEYLSAIEQEGLNLVSKAVKVCREIADQLTSARKIYYKYIEDNSVTRINNFIEVETIRIKEAIIDHVIAFHIAENDSKSLIYILKSVINSKLLHKAYLKISELLLSKGNLIMLETFLGLVLSEKNSYSQEEQPQVDSLFVRSAALALKMSNATLADKIISLIPAKKDEILRSASQL